MFLRLIIFFTLIYLLPGCRSSRMVYQSPELELKQLTAETYVHVSYLKTQSFGRVACNGLVYVHGGEALVFDTPTNNAAADELLDYIENSLHAKTIGVVANHFHADCLGSVARFHARNIPSYGTFLTQQLAPRDDMEAPKVGFEKELILHVGGREVRNTFFGEAHTRDNIVSYIPAERVLFGGCPVKELDATKGNVADANQAAWPATMRAVKHTYPELRYVVPGHGKPGGPELLDYTIRLFEEKK